MDKLKVTDFVKGTKSAVFSHYRQGYLYYTVQHMDNIDQYTFPIEVSDLQTATLNCVEKPLTLMRYIRKAIEEGTLVKI